MRGPFLHADTSAAGISSSRFTALGRRCVGPKHICHAITTDRFWQQQGKGASSEAEQASREYDELLEDESDSSAVQQDGMWSRAHRAVANARDRVRNKVAAPLAEAKLLVAGLQERLATATMAAASSVAHALRKHAAEVRQLVKSDPQAAVADMAPRYPSPTACKLRELKVRYSRVLEKADVLTPYRTLSVVPEATELHIMKLPPKPPGLEPCPAALSAALATLDDEWRDALQVQQLASLAAAAASAPAVPAAGPGPSVVAGPQASSKAVAGCAMAAAPTSAAGQAADVEQDAGHRTLQAAAPAATVAEPPAASAAPTSAKQPHPRPYPQRPMAEHDDRRTTRQVARPPVRTAVSAKLPPGAALLLQPAPAKPPAPATLDEQSAERVANLAAVMAQRAAQAQDACSGCNQDAPKGAIACADMCETAPQPARTAAAASSAASNVCHAAALAQVPVPPAAVAAQPALAPAATPEQHATGTRALQQEQQQQRHVRMLARLPPGAVLLPPLQPSPPPPPHSPEERIAGLAEVISKRAAMEDGVCGECQALAEQGPQACAHGLCDTAPLLNLAAGGAPATAHANVATAAAARTVSVTTLPATTQGQGQERKGPLVLFAPPAAAVLVAAPPAPAAVPERRAGKAVRPPQQRPGNSDHPSAPQDAQRAVLLVRLPPGAVLLPSGPPPQLQPQPHSPEERVAGLAEVIAQRAAMEDGVCGECQALAEQGPQACAHGLCDTAPLLKLAASTRSTGATTATKTVAAAGIFAAPPAPAANVAATADAARNAAKPEAPAVHMGVPMQPAQPATALAMTPLEAAVASSSPMVAVAAVASTAVASAAIEAAAAATAAAALSARSKYDLVGLMLNAAAGLPEELASGQWSQHNAKPLAHLDAIAADVGKVVKWLRRTSTTPQAPEGGACVRSKYDLIGQALDGAAALPRTLHRDRAAREQQKYERLQAQAAAAATAVAALPARSKYDLVGLTLNAAAGLPEELTSGQWPQHNAKPLGHLMVIADDVARVVKRFRPRKAAPSTCRPSSSEQGNGSGRVPAQAVPDARNAAAGSEHAKSEAREHAMQVCSSK